MYMILIVNLVLLVFADFAFAAHIMEPLGTEIAATTPRGRMFGQAVYEYSRVENGTTKNTHLLPIEFEIGVGERTQLNLEGETLLREDETGNPARESGVEEIAIGVKHRFLDETPVLPDAAFEAEFAPSIGLKGNEHGVKGALILTKNLHPRLVVHVNGAYELETEREIDISTPTDEVINHATWFYNVAPMIRVIPDRLMVLLELNGKIPASGNTELTVAPEVIGVIQTETFFALQNLAFKLAVPFGLNDHSPDIGVKFGVSKLF
ncbi:MAG: hypothetical protein L0Y56_04805 [Nitrospira sp.]|nr:hypothetical protein [Nitrospira sp.]